MDNNLLESLVHKHEVEIHAHKIEIQRLIEKEKELIDEVEKISKTLASIKNIIFGGVVVFLSYQFGFSSVLKSLFM